MKDGGHSTVSCSIGWLFNNIGVSITHLNAQLIVFVCNISCVPFSIFREN